MAYNDYGAFVYCNGKRRTDKEDAPLFGTSEEAFGEDINNVPSGLRIFYNILQRSNSVQDADLTEDQRCLMYIRDSISHGVMGDGTLRVRCYKAGLPGIFELVDDDIGIHEIEIPNEKDPYEYGTIRFEYNGYQFMFTDTSEDNHYFAEMITPEGDQWTCEYDSEFGAGFEDES